MTPCPHCGEDSVLRYRSAVSCEPHGDPEETPERHDDEWCECSKCGAKLTEREVERMSEEVLAS